MQNIIKQLTHPIVLIVLITACYVIHQVIAKFANQVFTHFIIKVDRFV